MTQMEDGKQKYQDVMVRSYPISMANQIVYTGFDLWDRVYSENLKALKVSNDGKIDENGSSSFRWQRTAQKTLVPGYIIFKTGEDSYTLSFNVLIKGCGEWYAGYKCKELSGRPVSEKKHMPRRISQNWEIRSAG